MARFGQLWHLRTFSHTEKDGVRRPPHTAVVVFHSYAAVSDVINASCNPKAGSFWKTDFVQAHALTRKGIVYEKYLTEIIPEINQASHVTSSGSNDPARSSGNSSEPLDPERYEPLLKRPRTENSGTAGGSKGIKNRPSTLKPSETQTATIEWLRAQIARLETELKSALTARNQYASERDAIRVAYEAEQRAHRETMSQKQVAEVALSQEKAEQARICSEFGAEPLHGSTGGQEKPTRSCSGECVKSCERIKDLQRELKDTRERHLQEQRKMESDATAKLNEAKATIQQLNSDSKRLESDLQSTQDKLKSTQESMESMGKECASAKLGTTELIDAKAATLRLQSDAEQSKFELASVREQLDSTRRLLESKEREYASVLKEHDGAKGKLETCKNRLENEQILVLKLRDMLISEAYKSLGASHESLGVIMRAMGIPPAAELGNIGPK
ncbi:hypothetical protein RSOLAG22IIIB_05147 [Rhizoctonia solani]|uniref:Uncharacterized protein n=1 Tax=Rhizoctonia solani TaxID=456999 RepID=A0A0K6G4A4_9AGAM|nr:hypothetical protein RSOLAG22IIIB_05147 [Rhizoctonia solani]